MLRDEEGEKALRRSWGTGRIWRWVAILFGAGVLILIFAGTRGCYTETDCPSNDPKIIALYKANNRLNKAFAHHDWESIHGMLEQGYKAGVTLEPEDYKDMCSRLRDALSTYAIYGLRTISYTAHGDTVETSNYLTARLLPIPWKADSDTTFHYWVYRNGEWYLDDWGRMTEHERKLSPEFQKLYDKLDHINDSLPPSK